MNRLLTPLTKIVNRYLSTKVVFILDMLMSLVASLVALLLVDIIATRDLMAIRIAGLWLVTSFVFSFIFLLALRTYRIVIRHMALKDIGRFVMVAFSKVMLMGFIFGMIVNYSRVLYVMMIADFFFTCSAFLLLRIAMLVSYDIVMDKLNYRKTCMNVLIYGVGDNSVSLLNRFNNSEHYRIVGFVLFGRHNLAHLISEKKVYYIDGEGSFAELVKDVEADAVMFASEDDARAEKDRIIRYAIASEIKTLMVPSVDEIVDGKITSGVRNIEIEDLLMRPEIELNNNLIKDYFKGKTIMVTGAAGSIGSELCRQLASFGAERLVLYDNAETPMHNLRLEFEEKHPDIDLVPVVGDVRLPNRLDYAFRTWRPQVVFHAAAYKHVPLMEENPCEAVLVNVAGSRYVADKCLEYDVEKMVMVSTDKAVNPTNIMGCTKRLAEIYIQSAGLAIESGKKIGKTSFVTTRFGNVLGSNGSVIPRFREQIAKGGPVTVTHPEITRFFMTIPEACRLVMQAAVMTSGNEIFVFDMGESVKIDDLARRMIYLAGFTPDEDIKIEYTGLRPGEKLYEEVLSNKENTLPTDHSRIRIAKVREYDYNDALAATDRLETLSREVEIDDMVRLMKEIVPEFISRNSRFEEMDKNRIN